jgi:hypothetical protein
MFSCSLCARVFIAPSLDPVAFPPFRRLTANLAVWKGFLPGGFEALPNSIICVIQVDAQPAKLFLPLQYLELECGGLFQFHDQPPEVRT